MAEWIKFDPRAEAVIVDHRLFTEIFNYTGSERSAYIRFLTKIIPNFVESQKKVKPEFRLLMAEHQAKYLVRVLERDPEVLDILRRYNAFKLLRVFEADAFLTPEQLQKVELSPKEEQVYYMKLMDLIREGYNNVRFKQMLLTGPKHAYTCADGIVDAGLDRVVSYEKELGHIEYKIVDAQPGDIVYIQGRPVALADNIAAGGEAKIFYLQPDDERELLAKIYCTSIAEDKPNCVKFQYLMRQRAKKLDVIFNDPSYAVQDDQIIFPLLPIYDDANNLIGVVMKNVKAAPVASDVLQLHSVVKNKQYPFKEFNRIDLIHIAIQIVDRVQLLHERNIIIGDINLRNFLITGNSSKTLKVHLIDLDGCQIPGFPALYETAGYSDPLWDPKEQKPRTKSNDVYALLILLFELFHVAHPFQYVMKEGVGQSLINDFQENMKNRDFPYVSGERRMADQLGKQPPTEANYVFSHMSDLMKKLFQRTLGPEDYRPAVKEVRHCLNTYRDKVMRYEDDNCLVFYNFAISPNNRVEFPCSFKNCQSHKQYQHIKQVLRTLQNTSETYQFCGEHILWHKSILKMERKPGLTAEELKEFREFWHAQVEKRDLYALAEKFFQDKPNHELKPKWEEIVEKYKTKRRGPQVRSSRPVTPKQAKPKVEPPPPPKPPEPPKQAQPENPKSFFGWIQNVLKF